MRVFMTTNVGELTVGPGGWECPGNDVLESFLNAFYPPSRHGGEPEAAAAFLEDSDVVASEAWVEWSGGDGLIDNVMGAFS